MAGPLRKKSRTASVPRKSLTAKVNQLLSAQEYKIIDTSNSTLAVVATGVVVPLNSIAAGDDVTQRNGRKITLVSSMIRFHGHITDSIPTAPTSFRLALVYDSQPNGVAPVWTDVFQAAVSDSDRNVNNRDRFKIVYDSYNSAKHGYLSVSSTSGSTGHETGIYDVHYAKLGLTTEYATTASGVPVHGGFFLMVLTDQPGTMRYYHRITFTDN